MRGELSVGQLAIGTGDEKSPAVGSATSLPLGLTERTLTQANSHRNFDNRGAHVMTQPRSLLSFLLSGGWKRFLLHWINQISPKQLDEVIVLCWGNHVHELFRHAVCCVPEKSGTRSGDDRTSVDPQRLAWVPDHLANVCAKPKRIAGPARPRARLEMSGDPKPASPGDTARSARFKPRELRRARTEAGSQSRRTIDYRARSPRSRITRERWLSAMPTRRL
jgi:hypothetical protein